MPLRRQLALWDGIAIYLGIILGSGVFFAPAGVAGAVPSLGGSLLLWLLGGLIAGCGALVYAECGARLPRDGGFFVFYRETLGEGVAFVGGWVALAITYPASVAVIAIILGEYWGQLTGLWVGSPAIPAAMAVALGTLLNLWGVKLSAWSQRVLTSTKVVAVVGLCIAAWVAGAPAAPASIPTAEQPLSFAGVLGALVAILWTYSGWSDITMVSGELKQPAKNLGRTVFIGTGSMVVVYALVQAAVESLLPRSVAAGSSHVVAQAVGVAFGTDASRLIALLVVISTFGSLHGTLLVTSRLAYAMALEGVVPKPLGRLSARLGTPAVAAVAVGVAATAYVLISDFRAVLFMFTFAVWLFYGLTTVALLRLRARGVGEPLPWRAPGGWFPPAVMLLTAAAMTAGLLWEPAQRIQALWGGALIAAAAVLYLLQRHYRASALPNSR